MYDDTNFSKYFSFFLHFQEPLVLSSSNPMIENSGLTDIHKQIYGYRASTYLHMKNPRNSQDGGTLEEHRRRQEGHEDTSVVTNIVFFLLCVLILCIIMSLVWFRFLKPRLQKYEDDVD